MNKALVFIFSILLLIFDDNVLALIGYPHFDANAANIYKIHPVSYLSILVIVLYILSGKIRIPSIKKNCRAEMALITVCMLMFVYLGMTGALNNISFIIDALLTPAIISILLLHTPEKIALKYKWVIYTAFVLNFTMALYEKIRRVHILSDYYKFGEEFRSSALFGHPLNNALMMSTIGIILYFSFDKLIYRIPVLLITTLSIFCFGARGALIGIMCSVMIGLVIDIISKSSKQSFRTLVGALIIMFTSLLVLLNTNLGDRILLRSSFATDASAQERMKALDILDIMKPSQILWGVSDAEAEILTKHVGAERIENFFVVYVVRFGIFIAVILTLSIIVLMVKTLRIFNRSSVLPILFTVLFVAAINNSLSTKTRAVSILVLCCYILKRKKGETYLIFDKETTDLLINPLKTTNNINGAQN